MSSQKSAFSPEFNEYAASLEMVGRLIDAARRKLDELVKTGDQHGESIAIINELGKFLLRHAEIMAAHKSGEHVGGHA